MNSIGQIVKYISWNIASGHLLFCFLIIKTKNIRDKTFYKDQYNCVVPTGCSMYAHVHLSNCLSIETAYTRDSSTSRASEIFHHSNKKPVTSLRN